MFLKGNYHLFNFYRIRYFVFYELTGAGLARTYLIFLTRGLDK